MQRRVLSIFASVVCLSGLALAQDVKYNYNFSVDFAKYHTYQWVTLSNNHPNQLVDQQIKQAIDAQLAAKGLTLATDKPDIQVGYQTSIDKERQWDAWGGGPFFFGGGMETATSSTINIGTLDIDFFDPTTKSVVWRGQGTKTLDPSGNPEKNLERLDKAVAKILKHFPPSNKK